MKNPSFFIGSLPIYGQVILAPLDGYSDAPFRLICRKLGSSVSYSEFINGIDVVNKSTTLTNRISFFEDERPFGYQILDNDPKRIYVSIETLDKKNPDFFDINLGCPSKSVVNRGAGAGLLKDLRKVEAIVLGARSITNKPLTAKIRLGWDLSLRNHVEIAKLIQSSGADCIAVHGRTRSQGYGGNADWDAIAEIKQQLSIPVIGNGDIRKAEDIKKALEHSKCDAVMIGRAAVANPWIFSYKNRERVTDDELKSFLKELLGLMCQFYSEERGTQLFRKYAHLLIKPYSLPREKRKELFTINDPNSFLARLYDFIDSTINISSI